MLGRFEIRLVIPYKPDQRDRDDRNCYSGDPVLLWHCQAARRGEEQDHEELAEDEAQRRKAHHEASRLRFDIIDYERVNVDGIYQATHNGAEGAQEPEVRCGVRDDRQLQAEDKARGYDKPEAARYVVDVPYRWRHNGGDQVAPEQHLTGQRADPLKRNVEVVFVLQQVRHHGVDIGTGDHRHQRCYKNGHHVPNSGFLLDFDPKD